MFLFDLITKAEGFNLISLSLLFSGSLLDLKLFTEVWCSKDTCESLMAFESEIGVLDDAVYLPSSLFFRAPLDETGLISNSIWEPPIGDDHSSYFLLL